MSEPTVSPDGPAPIGHRKLVMYNTALAALSGAFVFAVVKGASAEGALETFAWALVALATSAMGWNGIEHWAKNRPARK